jgi:TPR repeat protein
LASAEAGDSWAQNRVGWWYMTGNGVEKNYDLAEVYFYKAAAKGNASAKSNLKSLELLRKKSQ